MTHEEHIYYYPLYSPIHFLTFLRYCKPTAKIISEKTGGRKNWRTIMADMIWSNIRYGAMDSRDYLLFEFWKKSSIERECYFTKRRYFKLIKHFDKITFCHPDGKAWIYKKYSDFIKRDWILVDQNTPSSIIYDFFLKHNEVLIKPLSSEQGQGISIIKGDDLSKIEEIKDFSRKHPVLLEELCKNCEYLDAINKSSLNTLRITTIVNNNDKISIICACLRCGCNNSVVDNWGAGGVCYPIDLDSGLVYGPGIDKKGNKHIVHPGTSINMPGFKIPRFKEACRMAVDIIEKDRNVVFAGLDIAILPDRVELIEVNFPAGHDMIQAVHQKGINAIMNTVKKSK